jgi:hypothetical protein
MSKLVFGTDPEVFVTERKNDKEYAIPMPHFFSEYGIKPVEVDELKKHPVLIKRDDYKVIMDGVSFELNVRPASDAKSLHATISNALDEIGNFADKYGYNLSVKPTVNYEFNRFFKPDDDMLFQCGIFGCDKDKDAILESYDSPEIDAVEHEYRYGGGHLHISDDNELVNIYPVAFVKFLAIFCGNYAVANSKYPTLEHLRAWKYGQPGRYRIQKYPNKVVGVEYRTPSNNWISELSYIEGMLHHANLAYEALKNKRSDIILDYIDDTIKAISDTNINLANQVLSSIS